MSSSVPPLRPGAEAGSLVKQLPANRHAPSATEEGGHLMDVEGGMRMRTGPCGAASRSGGSQCPASGPGRCKISPGKRIRNQRTTGKSELSFTISNWAVSAAQWRSVLPWWPLKAASFCATLPTSPTWHGGPLPWPGESSRRPGDRPGRPGGGRSLPWGQGWKGRHY